MPPPPPTSSRTMAYRHCLALGRRLAAPTSRCGRDRPGADRMLAHVARRNVAGVDRRVPVGEQHQKRRLRPLQMKGDLVIAVDADPLEVAIPGFGGIDAEL